MSSETKHNDSGVKPGELGPFVVRKSTRVRNSSPKAEVKVYKEWLELKINDHIYYSTGTYSFSKKEANRLASALLKAAALI